MYGLKKRSKQDESGLIQGAGTGTSDDVQKNVPAGSYIMPADSTQEIGVENLQNMGSPTPVNLSNGEFQLSPDQVHSVGVQTLDAMKGQTHTPVDQPKFGFKQGQNKPELFFANGGLVPSSYPSADDIRRAQQNRIGGPQMRDVSGITRDVSRPLPQTYTQPTATSTPAAASTPSTSPVNPTPAQGGGFGGGIRNFVNNSKITKGVGYLGAASSLFANAATPSEDYRERFGLGDQSAEDLGTAKGFAKDFGVRALGYASDLGNALTFGQAGRLYADKQRIADEEKVTQAAFNSKQNTNQTTATPFTNSSQQPSVDKTTENQQQQNLGKNDPYAIQQKGNSFSYANLGAAAQAREQGIPEGQASNVIGGIRPVNDPRGVANLFANTREIGANDQQIQDALARREMNIGLGMRGYGGISQPDTPQRTPEQEAERQSVIRAASAPIAGARGLTANQVRTLSDLQQGEDNRVNQRYTTDANNAAALQREAMGQAGQNYRTELGEQGTNSRFNANLGFDAQKFQATNDLANREFNLNATEKGFGIRNSARLEKLYEQYDKAETDEDRKSIQEKISRYTGGKADTGKDRYMTVGGGQVYDKEGGLINQPQQLFDTQTQQFIDTATSSSTNLPNGMTRQVGTSNGKPVYEDAQGNRFIGN